MPWLVAGGVALGLVIVVLTATRKKAAPIIAVAPPPPARGSATPTAPVPESAQRHLAQAIDYQRKLWCSDALEELDKALRDDPGLSDDVSLQRVAIACLTPKTRERAARLLVERVASRRARGAGARSDGRRQLRGAQGRTRGARPLAALRARGAALRRSWRRCQVARSR